MWVRECLYMYIPIVQDYECHVKCQHESLPGAGAVPFFAGPPRVAAPPRAAPLSAGAPRAAGAPLPTGFAGALAGTGFFGGIVLVLIDHLQQIMDYVKKCVHIYKHITYFKTE